MPRRLPLLTLVLTLGAPLLPAAETSADAAYAHLRTVRTTEVSREGDVAAVSRRQRQQHDEASRLAEAFLRDFPQDARRWEVIGWAVNSPRLPDPARGSEDAAWTRRRDELRRELLGASGVPEPLWVGVAERTIGDLAGFRGTPVRDLAWAGQVVAELARRFPASDRRKFAEQAYLRALERGDPAAAEAFLRTRVGPGETNAAVRELAAGRLRIAEMRRTPLELAFTAADGRPVDLATLRGKVVLIDFWATWCQPCLEEMPHVRAAYQKYHDQGFEVIGISFDKAPGPTPRGLERTAEQVVRFAREHGMPWPHHYDGAYWQNEFGRRFAINELPTTFLLGKDGRLVTTEAHGEKLAAEVARLLALP